MSCSRDGWSGKVWDPQLPLVTLRGGVSSFSVWPLPGLPREAPGAH